MNKPANAPNPFKLELLEPRLLLSADPMTETVQAIVPDITESVIVESLDSLDTHEQNNSVSLISQQSNDNPQESDDIIEETDFYDINVPDGKLSLDIISNHTLDLSDISEDLTLLFDSTNTISIKKIISNEAPSLLDDTQFSLDEINTIIGGKGQNAFVFEEGATFDGMIDSASGINDILFISGGDCTWQITGFDSGIVDNLKFTGIQNLKGGTDNQDTFVFESAGHISGTIDGGDAGFDTLSLLGSYNTVNYSATSKSSGTVNRDNDIITYTGLEPIFDNTDTVNRIIGLSNSDDTDAVLSQNGSQLNITGSTFEGITFNNPSASLTIQGLEGTDTITVQSLDLDHTQLIIEAENIILPADNTIESSADIYFNATDQDINQITHTNNLQDRSASIEIFGDIQTSQNITLTASVLRNVDIHNDSNTTLDTETLSNAVVHIRNATINAAKFEVLASSYGVVITHNTIDNAKNEIPDKVYASIEESCQIAASQVTIRASRGTDYQATGRDAYNHISGDTQAWIKDSDITSGGDVSIIAEDNIKMSAASPELTLDLSTITSESTISASSARNYLSGNVDANLINSTLTVTGDNTVSISALRNAQIKSRAETDHLTETNGLASGYSVNLEGTYSSNILTGHTKASIESSVVNASDSDIQVIAKETSAVDARSAIAASSDVNSSLYQDFSSTVGTSIAFNALGWNPENAGIQTLDALANTSFATSSPMDVNAYILDSTVTAGKLDIKASLETKLNSTVSNTAETKSSSAFGAAGMSTSGILSSNMLNTTVKAYINNTSETKKTTTQNELTINANDISEVYSNSKIVSSAIITGDGGVSILNENKDLVIDADFETSDGVNNIKYGDRVLVAGDYANGGHQNGVYIYMGVQDTIDLSQQDFTNKDYWKEIPETQLIPEGYNLTDSDSVAIGGMVVRNDVRTDVQSFINNAEIVAGYATITAHESAKIHATADSTAESSGGSAYGSGTSIAANGIIATNLILSKANAYITGSLITTSVGDLSIDAQNMSIIDATNTSVTTTGDTAVGASLAFNTIGWESQNILFQTIDAIIGTDIGDEQPSEVKAYIQDSNLTISGNVSLNAESKAEITSSVSNDATSSASALVNASGMAVSGVLASNMVSSLAQAYIKFTDTKGQVNVTGNITINAKDEADIVATNIMKAISTTTNDGGASIAAGLFNAVFDEYDYTSKSGIQTLSKNDKVRIASDHEGYAVKEGLYIFIGAEDEEIDLTKEDYTNRDKWRRFTSASASELIPNIGNVTDSDSQAFGGIIVRNDLRSGVDSYIKNAVVETQGTVSLTADEAATIIAFDSSTVTSSGGSCYGSGTSNAVSGIIATNLVQSHANAFIMNSEITTTNAGDLTINAKNTSLIDATVNSTIASGDMAVGVTLAFNTIGWDAQNILSKTIDALIGTEIGNQDPAETNAYILDTNLTIAGDLTLYADNSAIVNATVSNAADSQASALYGAGGSATSGILSSNMVAIW
jgi:hypothetical protein